MPARTEDLRGLVERVAAFHITDKAMLAAQRAIEQAIASPGGGPSTSLRYAQDDTNVGICANVDAGTVEKYISAVRNYFEGFEREARGHLRDVDKRLEHANQVVFNLTAERGVAVKRIEATHGVLETLAGVQLR